MPRKKRKAYRTPAQKAATRKLIAFNKARAKKRHTSHSPTRRRKTVRRATHPWGWGALGSPASRKPKKRKARRTAAQKAATRKLVALNKARAKYGRHTSHSPRRPTRRRRATHPWGWGGIGHDWPGHPKAHAKAARLGWRKVAKKGWKPKKQKKAHSPTRPRHVTHGHRHPSHRGMSYRSALRLL